MTDPAPILRAAHVQVAPAEAFRVFTDEIGAWWPLPTHGLFGAEAGGVAFRDGRLVEQATDGRETVWGEVLAWEPPERLVVTWHPGREADDRSEVEIRFEPDGAGTRVVLEHRGWEAFGADAFARRRTYVGPGAWGHVLDHFSDVAEAKVAAPDLAGLAAAYDEFFGEADRGGFVPPDEGEFTAAEVLAHVALNDAAMLAVCQGLVHGRPVRFENGVCHDRAALARWIEAGGGEATLVERGRTRATQVKAAIARLTPQQRSSPVHCRLLHDGDVMVDRELPWELVAVETQATRHLPAHVEQLQKLRAGT